MPRGVHKRKTTPYTLSARDIKILECMAQDWGGPEIAEFVGISYNTFNKNRTRIYETLMVAGLCGAMVRATELGIVNSVVKKIEPLEQKK